MIYTYSFYPIDSRMYILIEGECALIVDPQISEDALELLKEKKVNKLAILLTHEHYDHISGSEFFRGAFRDVCVICSPKCSERIKKPTDNLSAFWEALFINKGSAIRNYAHDMNVQPFSTTAGKTFDDEEVLDWCGHRVLCRITPGHSAGSACYLLDNNILFSGDTLILGEPTITRLPSGSKKEFKDITIPILKKIPKEVMVYPGHGEVQKLSAFEL